MALQKCKECGKEVSTNAKACPHCGNPNPVDVFNKPVKGSEAISMIVMAAIAIGGYAAWSSNSDKKAAEEAAAVAAKEAQCKTDLQCWGDKALAGATAYCKDHVERLAKYSARWTNGTFEMGFERFRWLNKDKGTLTMIGDKVQFQNGFGAYQNIVYECDFDPSTKTVLGVRAQPGHL